MNKQSILHNLSYFNLQPEEAEVYVYLLEHGESLPSEIATGTKLKRPSVYNYLDSLVANQLAQWKESSKGKVAVPVSPENLSIKLDQLKAQEENAQKAYHELLPELRRLRKPGDFSTDVRYYQGVEGVKQILLNSLKADGHTYGYSPFWRSRIVGVDFINELRDKYIDADIVDNVIVVDEAIARDIPQEVKRRTYLSYQNIRYYPKDKLYISSDIIIYNNVYAVINLDPENPFGFEIYNDEIVKTEMSIFNLLWKGAKKVEWKK